MHRSAPWLLVVLVLLTMPSLGLAAEEGWTPMLAKQEASGEFAGWKSFSATPGTKTGEVWRLTDEGVLICRGTPKGYLATEKELVDFQLRLQWRWPAGKPGNGGVLLRMTGPNKIWPACLEAQLNVPQAGDFWGLDGFTLSGPSERLKHVPESPYGKLTNLRRIGDFEKPPGEWNTYEILVSGGDVTLQINGHDVNHATGCTVHPGRICLTAEGNEIHFRQVELRTR